MSSQRRTLGNWVGLLMVGLFLGLIAAVITAATVAVIEGHQGYSDGKPVPPEAMLALAIGFGVIWLAVVSSFNLWITFDASSMSVRRLFGSTRFTDEQMTSAALQRNWRPDRIFITLDDGRYVSVWPTPVSGSPLRDELLQRIQSAEIEFHEDPIDPYD